MMTRKIARCRHGKLACIVVVTVLVMHQTPLCNGAERADDGHCPLDHGMCLQTREITSSQTINRPSPVGKVVELFCHDVTGGPREYQILNSEPLEKNFLVFPSSHSTCQDDGTWSGATRICVDKRAAEKAHQFVDIKATCNYCPIECKCPETDHWSTAETYKTNNPAKATGPAGEFETERIICTFEDGHFHLNAITFALPAISGEVFVTAKVPPRNVVHNYSIEGVDLQRTHCNRMRRYDQGLRNGSRDALCGIPAYTNKVYLEFKMEQARHQHNSRACTYKFNWHPRPQFYAIPKLHGCGTGRFGCPEGPTVPNGIILNGSLNGSSVITYGCRSGFTLIDPFTMQSSDGKLTCKNGQWNYPTPVCRPIDGQKSTTAKVSAGVMLTNASRASDSSIRGDEPHLYSSIPQGTVYGQLIDESLHNDSALNVAWYGMLVICCIIAVL